MPGLAPPQVKVSIEGDDKFTESPNGQNLHSILDVLPGTPLINEPGTYTFHLRAQSAVSKPSNALNKRSITNISRAEIDLPIHVSPDSD